MLPARPTPEALGDSRTVANGVEGVAWFGVEVGLSRCAFEAGVMAETFVLAGVVLIEDVVVFAINAFLFGGSEACLASACAGTRTAALFLIRNIIDQLARRARVNVHVAVFAVPVRVAH